jgi:DNA modification methylase
MEPTWTSDCGGVVLYNADCLEVLPSIEADLVLTDPPYNVGIKYGGGVDDKRADYAAWCAEWFGHCRRAAKAVCLSPGNVNLAMWCGIEKPAWTLCWWKPAAMGRSPVGFCNWEPMLLWGKSQGKQGCDVIRATIKPDPDLEFHPCPKPLEWAKGFIELLTKPGMTVADPFMGSGTSAVASVIAGRRFVGCEVNPAFFDAAKSRIQKALAEKAELLVA